MSNVQTVTMWRAVYEECLRCKKKKKIRMAPKIYDTLTQVHKCLHILEADPRFKRLKFYFEISLNGFQVLPFFLRQWHFQ